MPQHCLESSWAQKKTSVASNRTQLNQSWMCFQEQGKHTDPSLCIKHPPQHKIMFFLLIKLTVTSHPSSQTRSQPKPLAECVSYVSKGVQVVVGEFEFLEGHQLPHPVSSRGRGVGVHVQPAWHGWLGLPSHHPETEGTDGITLAQPGHGRAFCAWTHPHQPSRQPWGDALGHGDLEWLLPLMGVFGIPVSASQAGRVTPSLLPQGISLGQCLHIVTVGILFKQENLAGFLEAFKDLSAEGDGPAQLPGESTCGQEWDWCGCTLHSQAGLPQPFPVGRGCFPLPAAPLAPHHPQLSWTQGPAMRHHSMATPSLLRIVLLL